MGHDSPGRRVNEVLAGEVVEDDAQGGVIAGEDTGRGTDLGLQEKGLWHFDPRFLIVAVRDRQIKDPTALKYASMY